ncbi:MAG: hypothetical protein LBU22_03860 [Dysgonamonadaceae bacterium]|jgi:hypothetical protein|nr:hypothetical protein [Dysgonamonadaceae bacterium]
MPKKPYKTKDNASATVNEPVVAYESESVRTSSSAGRNPNVPFHGTQEEWWKHFHRIEEGPFYPISEVHQHISQWIHIKRNNCFPRLRRTFD